MLIPMGEYRIKHEVDPRFVLKRLNASARFGGTFEFMFQAYVGHENFVLSSFHGLSDNEYTVRWDVHVAQTNKITGASHVAHQAFYQQAYPTELIRTAFEDEFPHLDPLQTDMALFAVRDAARIVDEFVKSAFQRWYYEGPPIITHDNSATRLPHWTQETVAEMQVKLDLDTGADVMIGAC